MLIESAVSSNRTEGVVADSARVGTIVFGSRHLRDRNEEEIRGYCDALKRIHQLGPKLLVSQRTIQTLHRLSRSGAAAAGRYKRKNSDIIETLPNGRQRVRFRTVSASEAPAYMRETVSLWNDTNLKSAPTRPSLRAGPRPLASGRPSRTSQVTQQSGQSVATEFTRNELERACPGVSPHMVRRVLRDLQKVGQIVCLGLGPGARWRKEGNTLKRG